METKYEQLLTDEIRSAHRQTPIDWEGLLQNIQDAYLARISDLTHAIQKEAIQNSLDARYNDEVVEVRFHLMDRVQPPVFVIQDSGTSGLTGRILSQEELGSDLPEEERWGRFEGFAFIRPSPTALGARGQGKFIFVLHSQTRTIVYDTLRRDGVYRLGARELGRLAPPAEGGEAKTRLKRWLPFLEPLQRPGARVIILRPVPELIESLKNGQLKRHIQTTWWRPIEEGALKVVLAHNNRESEVSAPSDIPQEDSGEVKVWIKNWDPLTSRRRSLRAKRLHLWHSPSPSPDMVGIAVLRSGMVITRIPAGELVDLPSEVANKICGYIEVDEGAETLLKREEDPTHYGFKRTATAFGRGIVADIRNYLARQLREFAETKLGLRPDERPAGFRELLKRFNMLIRNLHLLPTRGRTRSGGRSGTHPKDTSVVIRPAFPRGYLRANFGEQVNFELEIVNRTPHTLRARVESWTEQKGQKIWKSSFPDTTVKAKERKPLGMQSFLVRAGEYAEGKCKLFARLTCIKHPAHEKGEVLDTATLVFWVNQDPQLSGWSIVDVRLVHPLEGEYQGRRFNREFAVDSHGSGGYILKVNDSHPAYMRRAATPEGKEEYVAELLARALPLILAMEGQEPFRGDVGSEEAVRRSLELTSLILDKLRLRR
jgi:hypothetical protein